MFSYLFFAVLLIITPVADMKDMFRTGQEEQRMAGALSACGMQGSFVSNLSYASGKGIAGLGIAFGLLQPTINKHRAQVRDDPQLCSGLCRSPDL